MRNLIVNADDLGADELRNEGILDAIRAGVVTSTSVLANGPATEGALKAIRSSSENLSLGFHINLSEGKPLSSNLRLLVREDGCFLGKSSARKILMQAAVQELEEEIERELACQIEALLDSGLRITHVDGHQHVHVFPAVLPAVLSVVRKHEISWIRIPEESLPVTGAEPVPSGLREESAMFSAMARAARPKLAAGRMKSPDHFRGLYLKGRLTLPLWLDLVAALPEGLTELMVHPGRFSGTPASGPFSSFSTPDRLKELETLLDPAFSKSLQDHQVKLVPFQRV